MVEWGALEVTLLPLLLTLLISSTALAQQPAVPPSAQSSPSSHKQTITKPPFFTYADGVSFPQRKVLEEDQAWLQERHGFSDRADLRRILPVAAVTARNLRSWLSARVKLILGPDWRALDNWEMLEEGAVYPGSARKFEMGEGFWALNVGSALYQFGKSRGALIGASIPGVKETLPVRSPRVGLVQLGEHYFRSQGDAAGDRIFRLQVLFHEGRHSDGRGASLGFPHSVCPLESDYPGQTLCDANRNGPYSVDAALNSALAENCKECTAAGRDFLRLIAADSLSRVISFWKREEYTCNEITCRVTIVEAEDTTDWDATPEFLD